MATAITAKYLNQDKREVEALTVTLPAILEEGGGRTQADPAYAQFGEGYTAAVVPKEAILGKTYLLVEEAFASGAKVTIKVGATTMFTDVAVDATGLTVSTSEDKLILAGGNVEITLGGGTGDAKVGKLNVITNYTPYTVKNGRFTTVPA